MSEPTTKQTTKANDVSIKEQKIPEQLEEWVIENFRAVENDTLPPHQLKMFLDLIEKNQDDPIINRLYKMYEEMKNTGII